jgi:methyl-accepting chemotaxis protein
MRAVLLSFILLIAFIAISIKSGGEPFRWLGDLFREGTYEFSETADMIKESSDGIKNTVEETTEAIKKTGEKIKDTTGKAARRIKDTAGEIKNTTEKTAGKIKTVTGDIKNAVSGFTNTPE